MKVNKLATTVVTVFATVIALSAVASAEEEIQVPLGTQMPDVVDTPIDQGEESEGNGDVIEEELPNSEEEEVIPATEELPVLTATATAADEKGAQDGNPSTGVALAVIPAAIAAAVAVASRKRK